MVSLFFFAGCGGTLPLPAQSVPPEEAYVEVPYPPPAALAELVPPRPARDAVWRDGGWAWRGGYYVWERGGWVRPPAGARYAPWRFKYLPDGKGLFAESVWVDERGRRIRQPPIIVPSTSPSNEITAEFQTGR